MRKLPKQPNQRLLAQLQADRQWRRSERIAYARKMLTLYTDTGPYPNKAEAQFWLNVLAANGATPRHIEPSTRWAMGDKSVRTGSVPTETYKEYLERLHQ